MSLKQSDIAITGTRDKIGMESGSRITQVHFPQFFAMDSVIGHTEQILSSDRQSLGIPIVAPRPDILMKHGSCCRSIASPQFTAFGGRTFGREEQTVFKPGQFAWRIEG